MNKQNVSNGDYVTVRATGWYGLVSQSNGHACKVAGRWFHVDDVDIGCQMWKKQHLAPEPSFETLTQELASLPPPQQRIALSLVGLAIGDAIGYPFELGHGRPQRVKFHGIDGVHERLEYARTEVTKFAMGKRYASTKQLKANSGFHRTYTDDTTCCDLKMEAVAQAEGLLKMQSSTDESMASNALKGAVLQQYLKWAHGAKDENGVQDQAHGQVFFGTGAFTEDFLVPEFKGRQNQIYHFVAHGHKMYDFDADMGPFWPTAQYREFAAAYFRGDYGFPSWGNGCAMSFAPHPILAGRWQSGTSDDLKGLRSAADVLSKSHQEPGAVLAHELLWELLDVVYSGSISSTSDLKKAILGMRSFAKLMEYRHEVYPLAAFREWLENEDCTAHTAMSFLQRLSNDMGRFSISDASSSICKDVNVNKFGNFGALLHVGAEWDPVHWEQNQTVLKRKDFPKEPVLFTNRGLNAVIVAIFAAVDAKSPWEAFDRLIFVGGDTDTVGAIVGQIACPLLEPKEVCKLYADIVGLGSPVDPCLKVANAAARRYFKRSLLFASGTLEALREYPSLLDPGYAGLTDLAGELL